MPLRPFGLAPLGFLDVSPPDFVTLAHEAGFSSVAIRTRPAVPGGPAFPLVGGLLEETRRRIADTSVAVSAIEQVSLTRSIDISSLREMLETGAAVGASQVVCSGDDDDPNVVADRFAELCEAAAEFGLSPSLEFMPFRSLKTLEDAVRVLAAADRPNALICVDALHLFRSGGNLESLASLDARSVGCIQLCDAPMAAPPPSELAQEARERRLLPGAGELPLRQLIEMLPADKPLDAEVPLRGAFPDETPLQLAQRIHRAMSELLGEDIASAPARASR